MKRLAVLVVLALATLAPHSGEAASSTKTWLGSSTTKGKVPNQPSYGPALSADGRFLAFTTTATNLVPKKRKHVSDVYVKDLTSGRVERVSVSAAGRDPDRNSGGALLSGNGRYVLFSSSARNLVRPTPNCGQHGCSQLYLRDRRAGRTEIVSVDRWGHPSKEGAWGSSISDDGRFVAFSTGSRLTPEAPSGRRSSVYIRDRVRGTTELVSIRPQGGPFRNSAWTSHAGALSADGRRLVFRANLTSGKTTAWMRNLDTGRTVAVAEEFARANDIVLSPDGGTIAVAGQLVEEGPRVIAAGRPDRALRIVSRSAWGEDANGFVGSPTVSEGGRYVGFLSSASNLAPGDIGICSDCGTVSCIQAYVHDIVTGATIRASASPDGETSSRGVESAVLSRDGLVTAYSAAPPRGVRCSRGACHQIWLHREVPRLFTDTVPPTGSIDAGSKPVTKIVQGDVADDFSGVKLVEVTITPTHMGAAEVRQLTPQCVSSAGRACEWAAEMPTLPGEYEVVLRVVDRAGNETVTEPVMVLAAWTP